MDAARVYTKYLDARIRADRLKSLLAMRRNSLIRDKCRGRLPAGGRLIPSAVSLGVSCIRIPLGQKLNNISSHNCPCNDPIPVHTEKHKEVRESEECVHPAKVPQRKPGCKFHCKCKRPVIVVPSKNRRYYSHNSHKQKKQPVRSSGTPSNAHSSETIKRTPSAHSVHSARCPSNHSVKSVRTATSRTSNADRPSPAIARHMPKETEAKCGQCNKIPDMTKELCLLKQKLEAQIAQEIKQKHQLNALNEQLKHVCSNVKTLNDKCKILEIEKDKLTKERPMLGCECLKNMPAKYVQHKMDIECKASSLCQFCRNKNLPVLNSMQCALFKMMGRRCFQDIALTILLRADNVYHVNVRDLNTGSVLGCLLVSDAGIREFNSVGLFKDILTFCVIDVRSTINAKDAIFGGINFEFVQKHRLSGGNVFEGTQTMALAVLLDMSNASKIGSKLLFPVHSAAQITEAQLRIESQAKKALKSSESQVMHEIDSYSSSQVLADTETQYTVRSIQIASLTDQSSPSDCSVADIPHI